MAPATTAADVSETAADEVMSPLSRFLSRVSRLLVQAPVASTQPHASVVPSPQAPETDATDATDATDTADNQSDLISEAPKADTEGPADDKWSIAGITGHRVDPNDPTRLQLRISWDPSDGREWPQTWEPESTIQEDALEIWGAYIMKHDCRQVLGERRNK